ncbi:MAG TPA: copper amine oxidase N-terminal domain-containing protein [Candidatus Cryosericum sp.]|mgnify:CR=1 FL=1|nr:copper amine oxidase N-terminal domain-containing protein [Candidatus Cryosericum sp.]
MNRKRWTMVVAATMVAALAVPLGRRPPAKAQDVSRWHSLGANTIELWLGKGLARVNGHDVYMDPGNTTVAPIILNGRTMVPVKFVAEELGVDIQWDVASATVTITGTAP